MARRKSINDLDRQMGRIKRRVTSNPTATNLRRWDSLYPTYERYRMNMQSSPEVMGGFEFYADGAYEGVYPDDQYFWRSGAYAKIPVSRRNYVGSSPKAEKLRSTALGLIGG